MKPWNKIKWQAGCYQDPFDAWMQTPCEICGVRRWDCKGHDEPTKLTDLTNCYTRGLLTEAEAQRLGVTL